MAAISPYCLQDMRLLSQTTEGVYIEDPYMDIHPDILERYHRVDSTNDRPATTNHAELPEDLEPLPVEEDVMDSEEEEDDDNEASHVLESNILDDQVCNIHHQPISIMGHKNPFRIEGDRQHLFDSLRILHEQHYIPADYGLLPAEWKDDTYSEEEPIQVGA